LPSYTSVFTVFSTGTFRNLTRSSIVFTPGVGTLVSVSAGAARELAAGATASAVSILEA